MIKNFLIVDDERLSRLYIRKLLLEFLPDCHVFEAKNIVTAEALIRDGNIEILLLDIQMPGGSGFELLSQFGKKDFDIVFITAHSQHAIEAIRSGAVDYLLKPINKREFREMLERMILLRQEKSSYIRKDLASDLLDEHYRATKIAVAHQYGIKFIPVSEILYMKALNTYTIINHTDGKRTAASKAISRFEGQLNQQWFFRIHKSFIINLRCCSCYISNEGNFVVMSNGDRLPVSRHRLKAFMEVIQNMSTVIKL